MPSRRGEPVDERYTDLNAEKDLSDQIQEIQESKSRRIIGMNG